MAPWKWFQLWIEEFDNNMNYSWIHLSNGHSFLRVFRIFGHTKVAEIVVLTS